MHKIQTTLNFKLWPKAICESTLGRRLDKYISSLVHPDQSSFIKGRLASDNIRRLLHIIDVAPTLPHFCAILTRCQEGFWSRGVGLSVGRLGIKMVCTLYDGPTAHVQTCHPGVSKFVLSRSTRKGCPFSPELFAPFLKLFAQAIRLNRATSPISIKDTTHQILLYADDILLYISDISNSMPHLLKLINEFGSLSGYRIKWTMSVIMPLSSIATLVSLSPPLKCFIYLSIHIRPSLSLIIKYNFNLSLLSIRNDLTKLSLLYASLCGRINVIQMNILPWVNFLLSMIPHSLPSHFSKVLYSACRNFRSNITNIMLVICITWMGFIHSKIWRTHTLSLAFLGFSLLYTALKAYGVPWDSQLCSHSLAHMLFQTRLNRHVSQVYSKLSSHNIRPPTIMNKWESELQRCTWLGLVWNLEWYTLIIQEYSCPPSYSL